MQEDWTSGMCLSGSGGYQWAVIALRSSIWLHLSSGQDYNGRHTHLLSLSLFSEWTSDLFIDLFPALSLSISCWLYPDPLAVSWPWAITYLTISIKLVWSWNSPPLDLTKHLCLSGRQMTFLGTAKTNGFCKASQGIGWKWQFSLQYVMNGQTDSSSFPSSNEWAQLGNTSPTPLGPDFV